MSWRRQVRTGVCHRAAAASLALVGTGPGDRGCGKQGSSHQLNLTHGWHLCPAGIKPEQVDILITNCSIFCPTPSLASMLINKFKFRRDVQSYNLGGMGCSIGVIAIGLVRDMLQVR